MDLFKKNGNYGFNLQAKNMNESICEEKVAKHVRQYA